MAKKSKAPVQEFVDIARAIAATGRSHSYFYTQIKSGAYTLGEHYIDMRSPGSRKGCYSFNLSAILAIAAIPAEKRK